MREGGKVGTAMRGTLLHATGWDHKWSLGRSEESPCVFLCVFVVCRYGSNVTLRLAGWLAVVTRHDTTLDCRGGRRRLAATTGGTLWLLFGVSSVCLSFSPSFLPSPLDHPLLTLFGRLSRAGHELLVHLVQLLPLRGCSCSTSLLL